MEVYREITPNLLEKSSCALGMFDGVHIGHQAVLYRAKQRAKHYDCPSVIVSFAQHPQKITAHTPASQLTTLDERLDLFDKFGIDVAVMLTFDEHLSNMNAYEYLKSNLIDGLHAKSITIGYDHHFGKAKQGDQHMLTAYADEFEYEVHVIPPVSLNGQIVSSSIIRKLLGYGEIRSANHLLGRRYSISGLVVEGFRRGRKLGFPTANVKTDPQRLIPECGVYAIDVAIEREEMSRPAVLNIGYCPTFDDVVQPTIEAHILNFDEDIYNKNITIYFRDKIREERKFKTIEALKDAIRNDIEIAAHYKSAERYYEI